MRPGGRRGRGRGEGGVGGRGTGGGPGARDWSRLALIALGLVVGYGLERAVMRRERARPDPAADDGFGFLPAHHRVVPTDDGGQLHLVERGEGRPLVLLHGVTLSAATWHYQLLDLSDRYRVIALDHRGHGRSTAGGDGYGLDRLARDLCQALETLDLRRVVLVGHSMGGMTVMRFGVDFPGVVAERVAGMVLVSTSGEPMSGVSGWPALTKLATPSARRGLRLAGRVPGGLFPSTDLAYLVARLGLGARPLPTHVELTRTMVAATPPSVLAELIGGLLDFNVTRHLERIDVPAVVVVGSRDLVTPPWNARRLVERLPRAELVVLDGAGHMPMIERRHELNEVIDRFVNGLA